MEKHPLETTTAFTIRRIRAEIIEECAKVCSDHADWASKQIEVNPSSQKSQIFATISNTADDCAAMIRDLAKPRS